MNGSVKAERWVLLEELFHQASELEGSPRDEFLRTACHDDKELRAELDALLASADKTLDMLKRPVDEAARQVTFTGRRIGPYVVQRLLSHGGMGRVFLAERADGQYQQLVAIKLMHLGLWSSQAMLLRFRSERQILAQLDHPNIARLLDGGVTSDGCPYLVMEYVDGQSIDKYCRENRLEVEETLELFRVVCSAVAYAHRNLVIHRDIKPGNILVTRDGIPKLLDFGIAKLLDDSEAVNRLVPQTRPNERLMTPEYASPEQIQGQPVNTATDVYALGVVLYQLLTGRPPFTAASGSPVEVARRICEIDPEPPSSTSLRNPDQRVLARKLNGDLDHIVLMALRKEPVRRYSSVEQLSGDIAAYLNGYPVLTSTGTLRYRASKFVNRHKLGVTAALIALLALIGFVIGMGVLTQRANRERLRAEHEAKFLAEMFQSTTPDVSRGRPITARELLDQGARRVDRELAAEPEVQASMLRSVAAAYQDLGLYEQAEPLAQRSYNLCLQRLGAANPGTADSLFLLANIIRLKGDYAKAEPLFRRALEMRRSAPGPDALALAQSLTYLGECLYLESKDREAETSLREALDIYSRHPPDAGSKARNYLALLLERKEDYAAAARLLTEAADIDRIKGADSPDYATSLHNLGGALIRMGDLFGAETRFREALRIRRKVLGDDHPDLNYSLNSLGWVLLEKGEWKEAEPLLRECLRLTVRRLGPSHPLMTPPLSNLGRVALAEGHYDAAERYFRRALAIKRQAVGPDSWDAAQIIAHLGKLEFDRADYRSSANLAQQALDLRHKLGGDDTPMMASSLIDVAENRMARGDAPGAEPLLRRALDIRTKELPRAHPGIAAAEVRLAENLIMQGRAFEAKPLLLRAMDAIRRSPFALPDWRMGEAESALGWCLGRLGQRPEARSLLEQSQVKLAKDPNPTFRKQAALRLREVSRTRSRS